MAYVELYKKKLAHNYAYLDVLFALNGKEWAVVSKLFCGTKVYIKELIDLGAKEICDSRISNLKIVKSFDETVQTVYIKPPAKRSIKNIVKYADVSFNSELSTIRLLSEEAVLQNKIHKIIIMIEMGDLREGVMGENLMEFYGGIFQLPNISITGLGTNLNCLNGVLPSPDKLIQLSLYKELIEAKFKCKIPWVTGGTSVILPMLIAKQLPQGVNHFRIGETLFFGNDLISGKPIKGMHQDVFRLFAEIIEIAEKPLYPTGEINENTTGESYLSNEKDLSKTTHRAIIDVGLLDISSDYLIPDDVEISFIGASSDMLVVDLGKSKNKYKVGGLVSFTLKYMGALRLFNSYYVEKRLVD